MDILQEGLRKVTQSISDKRNFSDERQKFSSLYDKFSSNISLVANYTFKYIPKFYKDTNFDLYDDNSLPSKLDLEARTLFLQRMSDELLNIDELESLRTLLDEHSSTGETGEKIMRYKSMKEVIFKASPKCKSYYRAEVFAQLLKEDASGVSIVSLFTYAMRKTWLKKTRIGLSLYDTYGKGFLRESELENFIADLIPDCPQLKRLQEPFHRFYICTVVRKFMFFLDPMRTGRIRLKDVLACDFLDDLLVLRNEELPEESQEGNWFSASSALNVYGQYLDLDRDGNGMLSRTEIAGLGTGTLTEVFIERLFQECLTYEGEMDYKAYLEFVLAMDNKLEPQSVRYFFKIFDIEGKGYLDGFSLNYFFRGIQSEMKKRGQVPVNFEDIKDELFDMARPADPTVITLRDLLNSRHADYFVSILTDLNEYWNYENRELN